MNGGRRLFWWEVAGSVLSAALLALTLVSREWIEEIFGVDPDRGSGALEWAIVLALAAATVLSTGLATRQWHRLRTADG